MDTPPENHPKSHARSLWIWVIFAFVLLISAWTLLITIATRNNPEVIEVEDQRSDQHP